MRTWLWIGYSLALVGCSFQSNATLDGLPSDGATLDSVSVDGPTIDASNVFMVDHVGIIPPAKLSASFTVPAGDHNIDTTNPGGLLALQIVAQAGGGPQLAIGYFDELTITGNLFVFGTRPLVLIANKITVIGNVNASAAAFEPGPGGGKPGSTDPGTGGNGESPAGLNDDSGGGGGGFGSPGAIGGKVGATNAGVAGAADALPQVPTLRGGGAGGASTRCPSAVGGGGGGAVQLSARLLLQINGILEATGGGGSGGAFCGALDAGSGGGAGGAIYLQAPSITMTGSLFANGGGGGAGAGPTTIPATANAPTGADGLAARQAAPGGASINGDRNGGNGAAYNGAELINATPGGTTTNGGGGGGGVGRIVIHGGFTGTHVFSPEPTFF